MRAFPQPPTWKSPVSKAWGYLLLLLVNIYLLDERRRRAQRERYMLRSHISPAAGPIDTTWLQACHFPLPPKNHQPPCFFSVPFFNQPNFCFYLKLDIFFPLCVLSLSSSSRFAFEKPSSDFFEENKTKKEEDRIYREGTSLLRRLYIYKNRAKMMLWFLPPPSSYSLPFIFLVFFFFWERSSQRRFMMALTLL